MRQLTRSALIGKSPDLIYALINDIEAYPQFVPWCTRAVIESRSEREIVATLGVRRGPLRTEFTTRNTLDPGRSVAMEHLRSFGADLHLVLVSGAGKKAGAKG